jgi:hypothetical protein
MRNIGGRVSGTNGGVATKRLNRGSLAVGMLFLAPLLASLSHAQETAPHGVVPLKETPSDGIERVWGDPATPGAPFVIRIHRDAGHIALPHTHPVDENITVVRGTWSLGMGRQFSRPDLVPMELGAYGFAPKGMPHFAWSQTDTILQVHGIGPFSIQFVDPVYELTDTGVLVRTSLGQPGRPAPSIPPDCFGLKMGAQVRGRPGEGVVIGAFCSPSNRLSLYWVGKPAGGRFWAPPEELTVE